MTTDHFPECPMLDERYPKHPLERCDYCEMLRACEARIEFRNRQSVNELLWQIGVTRDDSFAAGLNAAREAIKKQALYLDPECEYRALSAIDTLINPPPLPPTTGRAHKY